MKKWACCIILFLVAVRCREKYVSPVTSPATGYLVVEGFINSGSEPTTILLTRTTGLVDTASIIYERNAGVTIEGDNNESFSLSETGSGVYTSAPLALSSGSQYRLHIRTADGNEYFSGFSPVKDTPPIDSISWQRDSDGLHFFIETHDPQSNAKFYQWQYDETWEFHSPFTSQLLYVSDAITQAITGVDYRFNNHNPDFTIYKCWKSPHSTSILIGSTEKLTTDRIYLPLYNIEAGAQQLSVLYSVNVKQHAISKSNFQFLQKMKKNTEQLGTIFDAQPSELIGNIHCISNPALQVVGYIEVSQLRSKRIFISNLDVPNWNYRSGCGSIVIDNIQDSILKYGSSLLPTNAVKTNFSAIISFEAAQPTCVDCTLTGSNIKPDFWP